MAEKSTVFAFWQEKERAKLDKNKPTPARISPSTPRSTKGVEFVLPTGQKQPMGSDSGIKRSSTESLPLQSQKSKSIHHLDRVGIDNADVRKPLTRSRPHSVMILSRRFETGVQTKKSPNLSPETHRLNLRVMDNSSDLKDIGSNVGTIKSAPPTIDSRKPTWGRLNSLDPIQPKQLHHSSSAAGFISYLENESTDTSKPNGASQFQRKLESTMSRSSPVITKVPRIRHFSALSVRRETIRITLRERKWLKDPIIEEVEAFWDIVKRIITEKEKECTYLTSPTITRFTPQVNKGSGRGQGDSSPRDSFRNGLSTNQTSDVVLIVEPGPVIKGLEPIEITCKVTCLVQEAIAEVLSLIRHAHNHTHKPIALGQHNYQLKVCGRDEYLESDRCLLDFQYTHNCIKLNVPVNLVLMERSLVKQLMSRTATVNPEMPTLFARHALSLHELNTVIDSYFTKDEEFRNLLTRPPVNYIRMCHQTLACVRHVCERMGFIQPVCVSEAVFDLERVCNAVGGAEDFSMGFQVDSDEQSSVGTKRSNTLSSCQLQQIRDNTATDVVKALDHLKEVVQSTIVMYCQLHHCPYEPVWVFGPEQSNGMNECCTESDMRFRVNIRGLHRIPINEFSSFNTFKIEVCIYHGGKRICKKVLSPPAKLIRNFYSSITWSKWLKPDLTLCRIPREARVCFTLYGLNPPSSPKEYLPTMEPLAWVAKQLFSTNGKLVSGPCLLGMWRDDSPADPTDTPYPNMDDRKCLILDVDFDDYEYHYGTSSGLSSERSTSILSPARPAPPQALSKNMQDIAAKDRFESLKDKDLTLVWSHRNSLSSLLSPFARGLPIFAQSIPTWDLNNQKKFHNLLSLWPICDPSHGLELLGSQYCDIKLRLKATEMISQYSEDDFLDLLPQLLQSLKNDCYMDSPMHELLLKQAIASPRTAHYLYWNLVPLTSDPRFGWRYELLLSAVLAACGEELMMELAQQSDFIDCLAEIASSVKNTRDVQRQSCLVQALQTLSMSMPPVFRLPLNPALQCCDVDLQECSFFNSKTVPLKLSFKNADPFGKNIQVIFKAGDDLRQDMLALQLIQLMDKIWLKAGLDLRLILYQVLATGGDSGFVELVTDSATLRQIQTQYGVTGSFKDKPLWEWLMRYNSSDSAWKRATDNFTHSCAGYCVATYVLGICDRHNDNIMVKKSGHMFHIDFGKILGNAQMFGSIKRDRAPFVLTPDMAYVINAGDKPSVRFQKFTDLCCAAYNELRKHSHLFLSLLSLLLSSNLPELSSMDDIKFVRDALLPSATEEEATFLFTKHIEASLSSISTQINFFIHNLAQYKFSSQVSSHGLLSFSPTSYSIVTDGKISSAVVVAYHLRFYPDRYIAYQIQVHRCNSTKEDTILFRRYSEFNELHNKLLESFPEDSLPHLPGKTYLPGRSYTKETSEKRREVLNTYLSSLLNMSPEVSESDVVYTFLHCLLRDEQDLIRMREEEQALAETRMAGKVKLDLRYIEQSKKFNIMVQHVQGLIPREGTDSTDPYVKLYLIPDPHKLTKLKTKIARKTLNPTYNEVLHYTLTANELRSKSLQLTVWDASSYLSKECLGVAIIELDTLYRDLVKGYVDWFELESLVNR